MKRLLIKILLFLLPLLVLLFIMPIDQRSLYKGLSEDCFNHGIWIYDRIINNPKKIDIAFLGSSHTINGIDDAKLELRLNNKKLNIANLAYCRLGTNLYYLLTKEIIRNKKVKAIIIEVREEEDQYSHPIFPYIANCKDVVGASIFFNRDYFMDCFHNIYYKLETIHNQIFNTTLNKEIRNEDFGMATHQDTAKIEFLNEIKIKRAIHKPPLSSLERNLRMRYPRSYLKKIYRMCAEKKIKLFFLYIPAYETNVGLPNEYNTYIKYGKVLIPPKFIFQDTNYWNDSDHLNQSGASVLSEWVALELNKEF